MLNFNNNSLYTKFSILFFIIVIFGYWGIDLNSEELYIGFSFFFLVILAFVMFRRTILVIFTKSINHKYFKFLADLLVVVALLELQAKELRALNKNVLFLETLAKNFLTKLVVFLENDYSVFALMYKIRFNLLSTLTIGGLSVTTFNLMRTRNFNVFTEAASRVFNIYL